MQTFDAGINIARDMNKQITNVVFTKNRPLQLDGYIKKCDLIIVDELGYVSFDRIGAEHLFGFFSQCYEQTSLIVTTNLPFAEWPQVFGDDERLAGALLDRLTHHVHVIEIIAKSFRLNSSLKNKKRTTEPL